MNDRAELLRKKYRCRTLILKGEISLPRSGAARLVGPDCAYHLYSQRATTSSKKTGSKNDRNAALDPDHRPAGDLAPIDATNAQEGTDYPMLQLTNGTVRMDEWWSPGGHEAGKPPRLISPLWQRSL